MATEKETNTQPEMKGIKVQHIPRVKYPSFHLPETTTGALREQLAKLPTAENGSVLVKTSSGKEVTTTKFQAIVATEKGHKEVVAVPTKRYNVVQHKQVFERLLDAVNLFSPDIRGQVVWDVKRAYLFVSLPSKFTFDAPDGKKMTLGFSATNSYDGTTGVHIGAFGYRLACSNGMLLTKTLGGISVDHIHGVHKRIEYLFNNMELQMAKLSARIDAAQDTKMALAWAEAYSEHFAGKDNTVSVMKLFKQEKPTVWGLYNSLTDFYSHSTANPEPRLQQLGKAENLLLNPAEIVREGHRLHEIRKAIEEAKAKEEAGR